MNIPVGKKKLLFLITQSTPWGGAQRYVYDLATALHRNGWSVTVAFGVPTVGAYGHTSLHERLHTAGVPTLTLQHLTRAVNILKNVRAIFEIRKLCREIKPDIVH